jgi:hypothetical protein
MVGRNRGETDLVLLIAATVTLAAVGASAWLLAGSQDLEALRRMTAEYIEERDDPVDRPKNSQRMISLIRAIQPLDSDEKIDAVLDVWLYYDAPGTQAAEFARVSLETYAGYTLERARRRAAMGETSERRLDDLLAALDRAMVRPEEAAEPEDSGPEGEADEVDRDDG